LFAIAMMRGGGKTSLCEIAALWAILYGHRLFVVLFGAESDKAAQLLASIRTELESNESLAEDFPEVCFPIGKLEGINQRKLLYQGRRVKMLFTSDKIVLPNIPGSKAAGSVIRSVGIESSFRGMKHKRDDGVSIRPDLVIPDDVQTDESAKSPSQCENIERILSGAILGLAGPKKKIAGVMPCTVIRKGDVADNMLDQKKHPEWSGERFKMMYGFPVNEKLWEQYAEIYLQGLLVQDGNAAANAFYQDHREAMDAGARVGWESLFDADEVSAVQHAMNLKIRNERAFWAESQNEPLPEVSTAVVMLTADQIAGRVNQVERGQVPIDAIRLTAGIDVQGELLFWLVAAWKDDFTGSVVDYGTFPGQNRSYFTLRDAALTLTAHFPGTGLEGRLYAGLKALTTELLGRAWLKSRVERCLVDANWGRVTDLIYKFCRESGHIQIMPSHGKGVGASSRGLHEAAKKEGEERGPNWTIRRRDAREIRHCLFDANYWKSFVYARLATAMGDKGGLSLCGQKPEAHRLLADHLTAEYWVTAESRLRKVDEWKLYPGRDNHWFDCLVMSAVAASMTRSVALPEQGGPVPPRARKRVKFSERFAAKEVERRGAVQSWR
jgi:hypothetical protein